VTITVAEIARRVNGKITGDGSVLIKGVAGVSEAEPGDLTFLSNPKYAAALGTTRASAAIVAEEFSGNCSCPLILAQNVDKAFMMAAMMFAPKPPEFKPGVHPTAVVAATVALGNGASIGPYCIVEDGAKIGDRTVLCASCYVGHGSSVGADGRLYPFVSIREHVRIGDRAIIHNGVVIGSDGFGYYKDGEAWKKIPQTGTVEIGDDVEIGANTTVDRARFGKTVIGNGVKIDNLVQIAHNVRVGDNTAMAAQVGIAGSTVVGRNVQLGGQVGVTGHISIGDNAVISAKAGVTKNVPPDLYMFGYPAVTIKKAKETLGYIGNLPAMKKRLDELQRKIEQLIQDKRNDAKG
jgi:UDP-3-O-[3-hydroxymyristoyl] glucosamine N-acyltransferase